MLAYTVRRLITGLTVIAATLVITFVLFFVGPQDPADAICGQRCTPARYLEIKESLNLDSSKLQQFLAFSGGIVIGRDVITGGITRRCPAPCLGYSFLSDRPVTTMIAERVPVTLSIVLGASVISLVVGVLSGTMAARRQGRPSDRWLVTGTLVVSSFPYYIVALLAALYLTVLHQILPRGGYLSPFREGPTAWASGMLAAWLVLGLTNSTAYARYSRASMVTALSEDFVRTARSKGISETRVVYRHGLRAAMAPVLTIFGLDLSGLLAGSIFTEKIFDLPGLGNLALDAFNNSDLPVIMGTVLVGSVVLVVMNLVVDILYSVLDPRVVLH